MGRTLVVAAIAGLGLLAAAPALATFPGANGRIAYLANDGLHTILPSGQGDKRLPNTLSQVAWSPDGQRMVGIRTVGQAAQPEIYSMAADGADLERLTHSPRYDAQPAYSPSGGRIVFGRTGNSAGWVMTMRSNGSDVQRLAKGVAYQWSPDGRWITYVVEGVGKQRNSIWAMHPNGTDKHRLVFLGKGGGVFADFAPDSRHFLFTRCGNADCHGFIARTDGSHVKPAPCGNVGGYSPDGRWFLGAVPNDRGGLDLVRVSVSSCATKTINHNAGLEQPTWQALPAP